MQIQCRKPTIEAVRINSENEKGSNLNNNQICIWIWIQILSIDFKTNLKRRFIWVNIIYVYITWSYYIFYWLNNMIFDQSRLVSLWRVCGFILQVYVKNDIYK
jgi:hypothetical protein